MCFSAICLKKIGRKIFIYNYVVYNFLQRLISFNVVFQWQQAEDFGLKREIRTHMYKLREERLRNFYSIGDMDSPGLAPTKTPLTPSHGESLADQSFQSFKTKEIRDSESPSREFQISRGGIVTPDTSGWNIVTSSEVSPDGRARKTESIATTEGTYFFKHLISP